MKRYLSYLPLVPVVLVLGLAAVFAGQLAQIQFRLWRNGAIGRQLEESLQTKFPGAAFRSAASYKSETIYITVLDDMDDATRPEVEQWLRAQKTERMLSLEIWLNFLPDNDLKRIKI